MMFIHCRVMKQQWCGGEKNGIEKSKQTKKVPAIIENILVLKT